MNLKGYKQLLPTASVLIFLFLVAGCQSTTNSEKRINLNRVAKTDSLNQADPWLNYSYSERRGKVLYDHYCAGCHGKQGAGDGFNAYTLNPPPKNLIISDLIASPDSSVAEIIQKGGRGVNRSVLMPAYENTLTRVEIANLVDYIRTFSGE